MSTFNLQQRVEQFLYAKHACWMTGNGMTGWPVTIRRSNIGCRPGLTTIARRRTLIARFR